MTIRKIFAPALFAVAAIVALATDLAQAGLVKSALKEVALTPPPGARFPMHDSWNNESDVAVTLGEAMNDHAAVVVFADFTCNTLCGPLLTLTANALAQSGLVPGSDYQLIVLGMDGKDGPAEARRMKRAQIADERIASAASFLTTDDATVNRAAAAVGYRFIYDAEHDQFAHPAALLVVAADGQVTRTLSDFGLTPDDLRLALVEAGKGRIGHVGDRLRLLCYGFDPATGIYTISVQRALAIASGVFVALLAAMIAWLSIMPRARAGRAGSVGQD